jgi:ABC-type Na+ efflux pump permease subunit
MLGKIIALCFYSYILYAAGSAYLSIVRKQGRQFNRLMHRPKTFIIFIFLLPIILVYCSIKIIAILTSLV